jgi:exodeoxyribonuclease VII large subunit
MSKDLFNSSSSPEENVFTVSDLNREARNLLEENFSAVLVEGELSNIAMPASGHWYFTLKDEDAQVRCAMFRGRNQYVKIKPKEGMQIQLKGKLSLYEGRGDYQLIVSSISPLGEGALRIAFDALKNKLHGEGLFNNEFKQLIPTLPKHIGVITSPTGAAIRDIMSVLKRRFPSIPVTILPVPVQGNEAAPAMINAIKLANKKQGCLQEIDVLIIGRGGGSLEDLWAFNDEKLARTIFDSELPIVSAVGHEVDFTIADFVADVRAATPSAAAELLSPDQDEFMAIYAAYQIQLSNMLKNKVKQLRQGLTWLKKQIKHPGRRLQEQAQKLDDLEIKMRRELHFYLIQNKNSTKEITHGLIKNSPINMIREQQQQNIYLSASLHKATLKSLQDARYKFADLGRALNNLSPLNILSRGYSMTYNSNGELMTDAKSVAPGDTLRTRLHQDEIISEVLEINKTTEMK